MLTQFVTYWRANWLPLLSGIVIAAIVVPVVKWAAQRAYTTASAVPARVRGWIRERRKRRNRCRAAQGHYVGSLSIGDLQAVLKEAPVERLHPTYQDSVRKLAETAREFGSMVPRFRLPEL